MTHTPGEWKIDWETGEITAADGQVSVGTIYGADDFPCLDDEDEGIQETLEECRANGRLVEAAPDLLAACKALPAYEEAMDGADGSDENEEMYWNAVSLAQQAIARVEGAE